MGKGKRLKHKRKAENKPFEKSFSQILTDNFQKELRNSPIWDEMAAEFGEKKALKVLHECRADLRPPDEDS
ncbi:MAG: hypothetical protein OEV87_12950 [Phycisphaerae bacterium]|nr:hypothetical protein [Phycisphaerae bacterium]